jgi:hypothetical protein
MLTITPENQATKELYAQRSAQLRPGSVVRCKNPVKFNDGSQHLKNELINVDQNNISYFVVSLPDYEVVTY